MKPLLDLQGVRFGKRLVIARANPANDKTGAALWVARCDCGQEDVVQGKMLNRGKGRSCNSCKATRHGMSSKSGGKCQAYRSWKCMRSRVGKGAYADVKCCQRWNSFESFLSDMGPAEDGMTIDRIDPWKDYEPGNCRWAPLAEQSGSRRSAVRTRKMVLRIRQMLGDGLDPKHVADVCGVKYDAVAYISRNPNAWASI